MPKPKKKSKAQKAQVKVRDIRPKKDAKGGKIGVEYKEQWKW